MRAITQLERIHLSQFLIDVVEGIDAALTNTHPEAIAKIQTFIPKFVATITYSAEGTSEKTVSYRYFTYMDHRLKGKKRVYVSMDRFKNDLYMFYMSKERLAKLCNDPRSCKWLSDLIGNRWIITIGAYRFKDEFQLLPHLVAAELAVSRANKPPSNETDRMGWRAMEAISQSASKYRDIGNPYHVVNCTVQEFDFNKKIEQLTM